MSDCDSGLEDCVRDKYLLVKTAQAALTQWMTERHCSHINVYYVGVLLLQFLPTQLIFHLHTHRVLKTAKCSPTSPKSKLFVKCCSSTFSSNIILAKAAEYVTNH